MSEHRFSAHRDAAPSLEPMNTIIDPREAWEMAHAENPHRQDLLKIPQNLTLSQAFNLGAKAAEAALQAQSAYRSQAELGANSPELHPILATFEDLNRFEQQHPDKYRRGAGTRAWNSLMVRDSYVPKEDQVAGILTQQLKQAAGENGGKLDVKIARGLLTVIVNGGKGYATELDDPTIGKFGVYSISFMADFINQTLRLGEEERIPLLSDRRERS